MSVEAGHLSGGAPTWRRFPVRASITTAGIPIISVTDNIGVDVASTTSFADTVGLGLETVTYSATQSALGDPVAQLTEGARVTITGLDMGRVVTVSTRPDLEIRARMAGSATTGASLTLLTNTSASSTGTVVTSTSCSANDFDGLVWCLSGANVGHCRANASNVASVSVTVTVPFPRTIAVGDTFVMIPYNSYGTGAGDIDGNGNLQLTTLLGEADASIASGTGGAVVITRFDLRGITDSNVYFTLGDHLLNVYTS